MDAVNDGKEQTPVPTLTTNSGSAVENNQNISTAGSRGPVLQQDADAHHYRLGVNQDLIAVNKPCGPVMNYHRDGLMRVHANGDGSVIYGPDSLNSPVQRAPFDEPPLRITGDAARYEHRDDNDEYMQAGNPIAILTIGVATMLALVLLQLIIAGP
jgi:catalase